MTLPSEMASQDGLAYSLWLADEARPRRSGGERHGAEGRVTPSGVVILHGAGSAKESHHDFARQLVGAGLGAIALDLRGHGASEGALDGRVLDDIVAMGTLLRERLGDPAAPLALRGSSMGGYFALLAAAPLHASAVVAICPATAEGMRRGLERGSLTFPADAPALDAFFAAHPLAPAVAEFTAPVLLLHAEGDEVVPIEHSRRLSGELRHPDSRFIAVPGGHHRSIQHDPELQAVSLRFIARALGTVHRSAGAG